MATYEEKGQLTYKDEAGNLHLLYPKTKGETVNETAPNADANEIHHNGKYLCITNCPTDDLWCVEVDIAVPEQYQWQRAVRAYDGNVCHRVKADGVWHDWLWEDPPMIPGVEYATTERYNDRIRYVKAINGGEFPANGNMHIWLGTVASFPYYSLIFHDEVKATSPNGNTIRNNLTRCIFREGDQIFLGIEPAPNENMSGYNVEAAIWYTKL